MTLLERLNKEAIKVFLFNLLEPKMVSVGLEDDYDGMSVKSNKDEVKKGVSFANAVEQRTYIMEEDVEVGYYDGVINIEELNENDNEDNYLEISFENSENKFILEDFFYKFNYKLPKHVEEINWIKTLPEEEYRTICEKIVTAIAWSKENPKKNMFNRLDAILLKKPSKQLILLTEFYIFDFNYNQHNEYELSRCIEIATIDYITMGRSGNFITFHLVPIYKNKENVNKNYTINYYKLEKVICCISSSCFYDRPEGSTLKLETYNRQISVIIINDNFEINEDLSKITNFSDYRYF